MIIDSLQALPSTVTTGDELPVERGTTTYKIDYDALATAIIGKLGGDPVTVAHGGTGVTTLPALLAGLFEVSGSAYEGSLDNLGPGYVSANSNATGIPASGSFFVLTFVSATTHFLQIAIQRNGDAYIRTKNSGTWIAWRSVTLT